MQGKKRKLGMELPQVKPPLSAQGRTQLPMARRNLQSPAGAKVQTSRRLNDPPDCLSCPCTTPSNR